MRAVQVLTPTGPADVQVRDVDPPDPRADEVLVEVHRVGISFPDLLLSKGQYQLKPEPPFTLGVDFAGTVVSGPEGYHPGERVAGVLPHGAAAELVAAPPMSVFELPEEMSFDEGAALPLNYLTAHFALVERGQVRDGETVLVHGAAGGVGTATLQVAKGYGARTIAVVSTAEKAELARRAGADQTVLVDGFKDAVLELTDGDGVDVVLDVVGGDVFTDSLRALAPQGRLLVVGLRERPGHPTGQGQPAAAEQRGRPGGRLGRVRRSAARLHARAVGRARPPHGKRDHQAADRRDLRLRGVRPGPVRHGGAQDAGQVRGPGPLGLDAVAAPHARPADQRHQDE